MNLVKQLFQDPVGMLFLIITIGILIGRIPFGKFRLAGSGVLLVGLVFGHFGFVLPKEIQTIGVVLFVYAVGLNAGPHIVESIKKSKGHFFIMAVIIVGTAGALSLIFRKVFGLAPEIISGLYAGAMTSTPALAAAMEAVGNSTPSVGYGLGYPLGILGVIFMVQLLPVLFKINIEEEEKKYQKERGLAPIERRSYRVTNPNVLQYTMDEIHSKFHFRFRIPRIQRGEHVFTPQSDERLMENDVVLAVGKPDDLEDLKMLFGEPVSQIVPESEDTKSRWLLVSSKQFVGKKMGSLEISHLYGLVISRVRRSGVEIVPGMNFVLEAGDEIRVSGTPLDLEKFKDLVGRDRSSVYETDFFSFALGLVLGVLVGFIKIPVTHELSIGFGIAGGPLLIGLLFGYIGRFGTITGHMPKAAKFVVGEMGLYLFLAVAGSLAGQHFMEILRAQGILLISCGFLITLLPILIAVMVSRYVLKMNLLVVLGMICGGMTSTPALGVVTSNTRSDVPALAYTGIYPLAVVLTTLMAQVIVLF
ncbi:MAG: hypothetical protein JW893_04035 [Candidatus Omnitrophica bacterium]|nr:hypothetical protein [Candidatus Omnitrophota bacterium]